MKGLICLNAFALIIGGGLKTVQAAPIFFSLFLRSRERAGVPVFTVENLLRIWACTFAPKYSHPVFGGIRFAFAPPLVIDLLDILPFYAVPLLTPR